MRGLPTEGTEGDEVAEELERRIAWPLTIEPHVFPSVSAPSSASVPSTAPVFRRATILTLSLAPELL